MADFLANIKRALVPGGDKGLSIDNWTFKVQTVMTSAILIGSAMAVTAKQFFGEPIRCDGGKVLFTYCPFRLPYKTVRYQPSDKVFKL